MRDAPSSGKMRTEVLDEATALALVLLGLVGLLAGGVTVALLIDWLLRVLAHVPIPGLQG